jgi:UDP-N-acetylenolpyruvoylglucosamine reductase
VREGAHSALLERIGRFVSGEVKPNHPLAPWTSVRVGGNAELWVRPNAADALVALLRLAREEGVGITILGGGANTLVGDGGVPGVVLRVPPDLLPEEKQIDSGGGQLTLCAGAAIARLITLMRGSGLVGAEFLAGIPGTIGGAVTMNAGTKHGECMSIVEAVELATPEGIGGSTRANCRTAIGTPISLAARSSRARGSASPSVISPSRSGRWTRIWATGSRRSRSPSPISGASSKIRGPTSPAR